MPAQRSIWEILVSLLHAVRCRKQMQNAKNFFIVSLACSDIVALLVSTPFSTLNFGHLLREMPEAVCKSIVPTGCVVMIISVYTHVAIAYERRRAIVFPLLPKPSPRIIKTFITIIWLVPTFVIGPTIYHISRVFQRQFCTFSFLIGPAWRSVCESLFCNWYSVELFYSSRSTYMVISTDYLYIKTKYRCN